MASETSMWDEMPGVCAAGARGWLRWPHRSLRAAHATSTPDVSVMWSVSIVSVFDKLIPLNSGGPAWPQSALRPLMTPRNTMFIPPWPPWISDRQTTAKVVSKANSTQLVDFLGPTFYQSGTISDDFQGGPRDVATYLGHLLLIC